MTVEQGGDAMQAEPQAEPQPSPEGQAAAAGQAASEGQAAAEGQGASQGQGAAEGAVPPAGESPKPADEYLAALQRLKADFDNYRRRVGQEQARWGDAAVAAFVLQLLPVVDNLERAIGASGTAEAVRQGVELTVRQLREVLAAAGVKPMEALGQPFDPARHEAVARGPAEGFAEGLVAEEYRRGYLFRDQVLRPAMVKVSDGSAAAEAPKEGER